MSRRAKPSHFPSALTSNYFWIFRNFTKFQKYIFKSEAHFLTKISLVSLSNVLCLGFLSSNFRAWFVTHLRLDPKHFSGLCFKKRYFYRILCQNQALSICPLSSNSSLFFGIHVILSWFNFDFIFSFHPNFGLIWLDKRPDIGFLKTTSTFSPRTIIKFWRTEALLKS